MAGAEEEERTAAPIMKLKEVDTLEDHTHLGRLSVGFGPLLAKT